MNVRDFYNTRKPWSARKHRLLGKYLPPFSAKVAIASDLRTVFCIDGFAGAAMYDDGAEGSPLLIAKFSDVCQKWRNPVDLRIINIEADKYDEGIFESLELATADWVRRGKVRNIRKEFSAAGPEILNEIRNYPVLFFIDPLGPTHIHFEHLKPIVNRQQRITELIINFDTDGLYRIAKAALSPKTDPRGAKTNVINVENILGSGDWLSGFTEADSSGDEGRLFLLRKYMENLAGFGYDVVAYPIRESLEKTPQYHYVFCTRHIDGMDLMNDFVREEEDILFGEHVETNFPLFNADIGSIDEVTRRRQVLRPMVEGFILNRDRFTRKQIRQSLLKENFGQFHNKDFADVIKKLMREKVIKESNGKTRINDNDILLPCTT